jgi:hypothetical protein
MHAFETTNATRTANFMAFMFTISILYERSASCSPAPDFVETTGWHEQGGPMNPP